jgi:type I restriction enzyme, S subunit
LSKLITLPKGWVETDLESIRLNKSQSITPNKTEDTLFELYSVPSYDTNKPEIVKGKEIKSNKQIITEDTVLLCKINPRINRVWITGNFSPYTKICSTEWIPFFKQTEIYSKYILYFLRNNAFRNYLSLNVSGVGGSLTRIKPSILSHYLIPLPPLNEQKRIVSKIEELFSELDHTKDTLQKVKLQLAQYRQSLLKSAFEGKLTEEWRERNMPKLHADWSDYVSQRKSIEKIAKKNFDNFVTVPDNYCWVNFKIISNSMKNGIYKEKKFYSEDGIACLRMYNIENNKIVWKKIKRMNLTSEEIKEFQLLPNDILFNRVNSLELVGKSALITEGLEDCVYESKNIRLRLDMKKINPKFVYFWLIIAGSHYFYNNFQQTTGMASVNQTQLGELPIPYCTIEEQQEIVTQIELEFSLIENTEFVTDTMLKQLETLRSSILKQAFEGKLVPQNSNDEPAEKLLQRIKEQKSKQTKTKSRGKK